MIFRLFGHRAPREPLLFLLWMILGLTSLTLGAIRMKEEPTHTRSRKTTHTKRDDPKVLAANLHAQHEFPYRYVFPANHPYSMYAHYLGRPPPTHDVYPHQSGADHQGSYVLPQEYKYLIKHQQPQAAYQTNVASSPFVPNSLPVPSMSVHSQPSPAPLILLVHAGPAGNGANGPFQTFVLIPADGSNHLQNVNNLAAVFANGGTPNVQLAPQEPPSPPYGSVGLSQSPNLMPITQAPPLMLFRPSHHSKNTNNKNNNHLHHGLLQRPISVYPMPGHKYYSHKKNTVESRMAEKELNKKQAKQTTSTEATPNYLTTRS